MSKLYNDTKFDNPKSRIVHFCRSIGISSHKNIEEFFNFSNGFFKGSGGMNTDSLLKIIQAYPQLNLDWVISGRGDMLLCADGMPMAAQCESKYKSNSPHTLSKQAIKVFEDMDAFTNLRDTFPTKWYMATPAMLRSDQDCMVRINDSGLEPMYHKDEYLVLSCVDEDQWGLVLDSKILLFVVCIEARPMIGVIKSPPNNNDILSLSFINPDKEEYPDIFISKDSVTQIWEVVTVLKF